MFRTKKAELIIDKIWRIDVVLALRSGLKISFAHNNIETEDAAKEVVATYRKGLLKAKKAKTLYEFDNNCAVEAAQVDYYIMDIK